MLHAIVVLAFKGRRDADSHVSDLVPGDKIDGDLAKVAIENGWAEEIDEDQAAEYDAMSDEDRAALRSHAAEETQPKRNKRDRRRDRTEGEGE